MPIPMTTTKKPDELSQLSIKIPAIFLSLWIISLGHLTLIFVKPKELKALMIAREINKLRDDTCLVAGEKIHCMEKVIPLPNPLCHFLWSRPRPFV